MRNKLLTLICLLGSAYAINGISGVSAMEKNDFAYSMELQTDAGTPFYELVLPQLVYEKIHRHDLGDLRVLNGAGQIVPHGLMHRMVEQSNKSVFSESVSFYPIYQQNNQQAADVFMSIRRDASGELIDIQSSNKRPPDKSGLSGYILDLHKWQHGLDELKISWKNADKTAFIRKINLSASDDLVNWTVVSSESTLVDLNYQNNHLLKDTVKLPAGVLLSRSGAKRGSPKYLKISFIDEKPGLEIDNIQLNFTQQLSSPQRYTWQKVSVTPEENEAEYHFKLSMKTPVRQLRLQLPETNTVVKIEVYSRDDINQPWHRRSTDLLYRLMFDGVEIQQTDLSISASADKFWKLQIDQQGGGLGGKLTDVQFAWQPQKLVFVARGQPPYQLVWGSARVEPVLTDARQLLGSTGDNTGGSNDSGDGNDIKNSSMTGKAQALDETLQTVNLQALKPAAVPVNWRQWILWVVLVCAAMLLVWMAVRLMKKMDE